MTAPLDIPAIPSPGQYAPDGSCTAPSWSCGCTRAINVRFEPGRLWCRATIREEHLRPFGNAHGGVLAAIVDPRTLRRRELPLPAVGEDDGVLRVEACGLCVTDHDLFTGAPPPDRRGDPPQGIPFVWNLTYIITHGDLVAP